MILTRDLSKQFDDFWAVDGVDLNVESGEVLALLGPNGAGKTTTVRMLTSVLRPTRGEASIAGFDIITQSKQVRASVGVLTEQHGLYERMPADEYLDFFGQVYGMDSRARETRIQKLLGDFGLLEVKKKRIGQYSKGMRQKLSLARALLHDPPVLLLDEPTSAMDPESARLVRDSIRRLRSASRAFIICTHNLAEAEELADQIAIIQNGKIIAQGSPVELKADYLGPSEYQLTLANDLNGHQVTMPEGVYLTAKGTNWIRYQTNQPSEVNPAVLRYLLDQGLSVVSLQEVARSIEQVYLQAVSTPNDKELPGA